MKMNYLRAIAAGIFCGWLSESVALIALTSIDTDRSYENYLQEIFFFLVFIGAWMIPVFIALVSFSYYLKGHVNFLRAISIGFIIGCLNHFFWQVIYSGFPSGGSWIVVFIA
jgi:hypothetical protein